MGARRIPHHLRAELIYLVHQGMLDCRTESGEIDTGKLTEQIMASLPSELDREILRELRDESVRIVIDSLTSDLLRDSRRRMTISGRRLKIRNTYRIPQEGGLWIVKELDDLTEQDIEKLEAYYQREAMGRLRTAKALREIRGFVHEPKAQFELAEVRS